MIKEGDTVKVEGHTEAVVIDDLATQYFVKDTEGNEFFVFKSQVREIK